LLAQMRQVSMSRLWAATASKIELATPVRGKRKPNEGGMAKNRLGKWWGRQGSPGEAFPQKLSMSTQDEISTTDSRCGSPAGLLDQAIFDVRIAATIPNNKGGTGTRAAPCFASYASAKSL